ncbi:hypothetical protein SGFS_021980 [Streptomyces graminofaciens]|uniref:Uncharacterized protein n=1 Tax=Streptomyces graminofaciens TaxID=68212 RepID=A0ABN5VC99_9ACTN|nr:hypothetical protein SGFS_021980 [Streptomyces graminofaciens]
MCMSFAPHTHRPDTGCETHAPHSLAVGLAAVFCTVGAIPLAFAAEGSSTTGPGRRLPQPTAPISTPGISPAGPAPGGPGPMARSERFRGSEVARAGGQAQHGQAESGEGAGAGTVFR